MTAAARQAWAVLHKELLVELRTREVLYSMGLFSVLVTVIFAFAFSVADQDLNLLAPGIPWVALTFAGTLGLARSLAREQESGCLTALLTSPAPRGAIFAGKALANVVYMLALEALLVPLSATLFGLRFSAAPWTQAGLFVLGTVGFAALGTAFSTMLLNSRLRDVLLPLVFYPVVVPVVIAGTKGTTAVVAGDVAAATDWLWLLAGFDAIFVPVAFWAFTWVVEE